MTSNLRTKKKNIAKSTNEMSKEMLIETLKKKKECNAKALKIVEKLCDTSSFDEEWLLTNLQFINQSHFDDVIVERAIMKQCGYPLCSEKLENVPSKKYHISTTQNKVFDITERKNFCSGICYKSGIYLKNQLLTSPLWIRDQEIIPKFRLFSCTSTSSMGQEIVFLAEKKKIKEEVLSEKKKINSSQLENVCDIIDKMILSNDEKLQDHSTEITKKNEKYIEDTCGKSKKHLEENCDKIENIDEDYIKDEKSIEEFEKPKMKSSIKEIIFDKNSIRIEKDKKERDRNKDVGVDPVKRVEQCIYEWFTFDTVLYLYGERKVKDLIKDREDEIKDIVGKKPLVPGCNEKIDRMLQFYSLLEQNAFDSDLVNKNLKPLPDYSAIKEDGKKLEVKVRAFYSGQLEITENNILEKKKDEDNNEENEIYLPTVDAHAQNSLRVKILLDRFNRLLPELIRTITRANCFDTSELRNLVNHFTLSSHNITFKPGEWYLIGFIVIKLLSLKNKQLESLLQSESGRRNVTLFLMNYNLPENYLDNIIEWLVNAESLIRKLK